jgi:hypothetical protein
MGKDRLRTRANVSGSLCSVVRYFEALRDPRHQRNRRHLLVDVITIAVCGVIVGCEGPVLPRVSSGNFFDGFVWG